MHLIKEVAEYYDSLAQRYHQRFCTDCENDVKDFSKIRSLISNLFTGCNVLEIACGTGYWTEIVANTAESVLATDVNGSMLTKARKLLSDYSNIEFEEVDAYFLESIPNHFSGAFSGLWWCHIPKAKTHSFLNTLHSKLKPGARVLHICQLEDLDSKNHKIDSDGNTIALRKSDSRMYHILKNIPSEQELKEILAPAARDIQYLRYPDSGLWSVAYSI